MKSVRNQHWHQKLYYHDQIYLKLDKLNFLQLSQYFHCHLGCELAQPCHYLPLELSIHHQTQYHQMGEQQFFIICLFFSIRL